MQGKFERQMQQDQIERAVSVPLEKIRSTLRLHWLAGIRCNHEQHTDKASCACGGLAAPELPSVGQAVDSWIDHLIEELQRK